MKSLPANPAGAAMLLETTDNKLLVVKANYRKHWTLPGGVIDEGESPLHAAIREAKEETGITIEPGHIQLAGVEYCYSEKVNLFRFIFRSTVTDEQAKSIVVQASEIEDYAFETAEQIKASERIYAPNILPITGAVF